MTGLVFIASAGSFGKAVAAYLRALVPNSREGALDAARSVSGPAAAALVIAAWRPVPGLCAEAEEIAYALRIPFISLIQDGRRLVLGPIVLPGSGPCWSCGMTRQLQHDVSSRRRKAILDHYGACDSAGPRGYLETFALTGAAAAAEMLGKLDAGAAIGGELREIDLITRRSTVSVIEGVHGCKRCGLHRAPASRSHSDLLPSLEYLWQATT